MGQAAAAGCVVKERGCKHLIAIFLEIVIGSDNLEQMGSTEKRTGRWCLREGLCSLLP
jgi:hypothetical protein